MNKAVRAFRHGSRRLLPRWRFAPAALLGLLLILPLAVWAQGPNYPYARGRVLVRFRDGVTDAQKTQVLRGVSARASRSLGKAKVDRVDLSAGISESAAVTRLRGRPEVLFAELDRAVPGGATPNDPGYGSQWHLPNIATPTAWDSVRDSSGFVVAVLDTGCDPTHPDLSPSYVAGYNFVDGNTNTSDVHGHGTAVAGCAGAASNNGTGIASPGWNNRLMPVRIAFNNNGQSWAYWSTVAQGMQWAVDHGAKVVNCSYVGLAGSATIQSAAKYISDKGGLFVACAGNDNQDPGFAANANIIIVSGTTSSNTRASFSNYGKFVTVSAPATPIYTTTNGGGYGSWQGTSFAAPLTCSVIALAWAANPTLSNAQVRSLLQSCADDLGTAGWDAYYGYGKVNAYRMVQAALSTATDTRPPSTAVTSPTASTTVAATVAVAATATDDVGVSRVDILLDGAVLGSFSAPPYSVSWDTTRASNGSHALQSKAWDSSGNLGQSSISSVTVSNAADTTPPTIAITSPAAGAKVSKSVSVKVSASDNKGVVKVELYVDGKLTASSTAAPFATKWNAAKASTGAHTLVCKAYDAAGNVGTSPSVSVTK